MDWPRLDTSSWNLSLGAAATSVLAACGPFVVLDGETDTDAATDTDPNPSEPSETDTIPPVECYSASDCEPGYECIGNACIPYDYYCNDGGCCYEYCCYDECCYGDCYYECYSDEQCGSQALCVSDYGYAACLVPLELPVCDVAPQVGMIELPPLGEGEIVSLSFVKLDGDSASELVVGRTGSAELHWGADAAPPVLLPVQGESVIDAVSTDLDGDGDEDIIASTLEGSLLVVQSDGAGGFSLWQVVPFGLVLSDLAPLRWSSEGGRPDLVSRDSNGQAMLHVTDSAGWFEAALTFETSSEVYSLAPLDYQGDGLGDMVVQDGSSTAIFWGDFGGDRSPEGYLTGEAHGLRQMLSGRIDELLPDEVIGHTRLDGWLLLELWANGDGSPQRFSLSGEDTLAAMGDFDGDGTADVIAAGGSTISYVRSTPESGYPTLACRTTYFSGLPTVSMAVADFDGNGRAYVALDGGGSNTATIML